MSTSVLAKSDKSKNRRSAFRIYEQVNLFYHKLDYAQSSAGVGAVPSQSGALPKSESQENDTRNVNISSSGIAFTTQETLIPGDLLRLRILLLSSMTTITTSAQVVYCRLSNPHELDRYPHTVGAQFVNMSTQETALLETHIEQYRKRQRIINACYFALIFASLLAPEYAIHLLLELVHHLINEVLHVAHLLFEYLEMGLDHIIEHQFHTDRHETQVIVFYTIVVAAVILLSLQVRRLFRWSMNRYRELLHFLARKKSSALYFWSEQSMLGKLKIAGLSTIALAGYGYYLLL